jgi:hypothetical protein
MTRLTQPKRIVLSGVVTFALFTAMKTSHVFSEIFTNIISKILRIIIGIDSENVVDMTDLIATPMILLSIYFVLTRVNSENEE